MVALAILIVYGILEGLIYLVCVVLFKNVEVFQNISLVLSFIFGPFFLIAVAFCMGQSMEKS